MPRKNPLILITVLAILFIVYNNPISMPTQKNPNQNYNLVIEKTNGEKINLLVEVADSEVERAQGLSGRKVLAEQTGILFVFPTAEQHAFWMKDMNFALDIIWLDKNWKIVD